MRCNVPGVPYVAFFAFEKCLSFFALNLNAHMQLNAFTYPGEKKGVMVATSDNKSFPFSCHCFVSDFP